uniref:Uncharacterized protein n=1 Tax=Magallana gigas TaxID=29159 RepID=A0A8W8NFM9_MAGGI
MVGTLTRSSRRRCPVTWRSKEPPPDDSYTGEAGSEASWMAGQAGNESLTEKGSWHSIDTGGGPYALVEEQGGEAKFDRSEMKFDGTDLKFYDEVLPGHRLIRIEGSKKACAYCDIQRLKTKSGWQIKSYFKCLACDIPLYFSEQNPAPPLLTPYLYNTSNVPPLDVDSPEQSNSGSPEKSDVLPKSNKKGEKQQNSKEGSTRKSRKSVKTKPMKIVFNEEQNDMLANDDSRFRKAQRSVQPRKGNPSPPSRSMYEQHPPESPATNTFTTEQFLRISGLVDPQPNLELVQTDPLNFTDPKDFYMTDDDGEVHRLIGNPGHKALTCVYCKAKGNKTACGWHIKCYYRCSVCDVPLCNIKRDCFIQFHNKLKTNSGPPNQGINA